MTSCIYKKQILGVYSEGPYDVVNKACPPPSTARDETCQLCPSWRDLGGWMGGADGDRQRG